MTHRVCIIGAASGLGAQDRGCEDGPVAFHRSQAWHTLEHHPLVDWGKTLFAADVPGLSAVSRIAGLCRHLADEVALVMAANDFPVVIGGDHSIAIGTWSGVARASEAPVGLLWIDAHLDRGRFRKRNLKHAKECSIQQRRGFACGVCRWKRRFGCSRNSAVSAARFESGFRERDGQGQHWRGPHSHGGFLKMIVCESGGHANGLTYFIFRFLRRPPIRQNTM